MRSNNDGDDNNSFDHEEGNGWGDTDTAYKGNGEGTHPGGNLDGSGVEGSDSDDDGDGPDLLDILDGNGPLVVE